MRELEPGGQLAGYRIDAVEREETGTAVVLAHDPSEDRAVVLHVARKPPGQLATSRFVEAARRLSAIEHPQLLAVYGTRTIDGRCVAVTEAPRGRRLDRFEPGHAAATRIVSQVAQAVDALEDHGADPPPLERDRIWVDDAGDARLDGLYAPEDLPTRAGSTAAELATLLDSLTTRAPQQVMTRALEGAYLSAGQFASDLREAEAKRARHRRRATITAVATAALVVAGVIVETLL